METKEKRTREKKAEFLRNLRKRMKELQKEEEKFRDAVIKKNKFHQRFPEMNSL